MAENALTDRSTSGKVAETEGYDAKTGLPTSVNAGVRAGYNCHVKDLTPKAAGSSDAQAGGNNVNLGSGTGPDKAHASAAGGTESYPAQGAPRVSGKMAAENAYPNAAFPKREPAGKPFKGLK